MKFSPEQLAACRDGTLFGSPRRILSESNLIGKFRQKPALLSYSGFTSAAWAARVLLGSPLIWIGSKQTPYKPSTIFWLTLQKAIGWPARLRGSWTFPCNNDNLTSPAKSEHAKCANYCWHEHEPSRLPRVVCSHP
jgi:hypothetical protein